MTTAPRAAGTSAGDRALTTSTSSNSNRGVQFNRDAWNLPDDELWGFVEIPAGVFTMGSDKKVDPKADNNNELPQHKVTLPVRHRQGRSDGWPGTKRA